MARGEPEWGPSHPAQEQHFTCLPHASSGLVFMIEENERATESGAAGATEPAPHLWDCGVKVGWTMKESLEDEVCFLGWVCQ